ncbi:MAG: restriction endonuclease subunit S [Pseudanabaena sp.]|jgi:type I restriction enzyme S subunit
MINLPNHQKLSSLSRNSECSGIRLKYGVELVNNRAETIFNYVGLENVESWKGKLVQSDNLSSEEDAATANRFYSENVLFGKLRPYLAKVFVAQQDGCCTSELLVLRPVKYYANYLKYLILNPDFINLVNSSTYGAKMPRASWDFIGNIFLPTPPIETQKLIATFLDSKTAAIDTLIDKKQRLIQLLEEKRTALINQAVTKGLNPNVPMKSTGVEWLEEVPTHWDVMAIKYLAHSGRKTFIDGDWVELPYITEEGIRLIQTGNVGIGNYREKGFKYIAEESFHKLNCTEVKPNDVLICRLDGPVGRACLAPNLGLRMITSVDNTILKPATKHNARFIVYLLSSKSYLEWNQVLCRVGGGNRWRVSRSMLGDLRVPVPPEKEQKEIANFLEEKTAKILLTIDLLLGQIEKLQEYRRSLITAAVTGKLNIKEVETNV